MTWFLTTVAERVAVILAVAAAGAFVVGFLTATLDGLLDRTWKPGTSWWAALRRILPAVATSITLTACVGGDQVRSLRGGETRETVERVMGAPDGYQRAGNTEALTYANRLMTGWSWDRADYHVVLVDGRVTSYGPGTIRAAPGPAIGTLLVVPLGRR